MKRLLSVALIFALLLSMTAMSAFSTSAATVDVTQISEIVMKSYENALSGLEITKPQKTDVATTSVRTFSISEEAGISFDDIDGYIYGYVGDADGDNSITVMDATQIQLHCADIETMTAVVCRIADADMDNQASVMDATSIQQHLASLIESPYINHVLYTPYDDFDPLIDTFNDIASFIKENGNESHQTQDVSYNIMETIEEEGVIVDVCIAYNKTKSVVGFSSVVYIDDLYCYSQMDMTRGSKEFVFVIQMFNSEFSFDASGIGSLVDIDENLEYSFDLNVNYLNSTYDYTDEQLYQIIAPMCIMNLSYGENFVMYDVEATVLDLVYDVQSLIRE